MIKITSKEIKKSNKKSVFYLKSNTESFSSIILDAPIKRLQRLKGSLVTGKINFKEPNKNN
jgi:hypothetical protein